MHQWRAWSDAVMVGAGTLRADDPRLTAREWARCGSRCAVIVGGCGDSGREASALVRSAAEGPVLVVCRRVDHAGATARAELRSWGVEVATAGGSPAGRLEPRAVAALLAERGVQTVLLRADGTWPGRGGPPG